MEFSGGIEIKMKVHKGGINLGMLSARNPLEVMDRLIYSLRELNVIYKRINQYAMECEKEMVVRFFLELCQVEQLPECVMVKTYFQAGSPPDYEALVSAVVACAHL